MWEERYELADALVRAGYEHPDDTHSKVPEVGSSIWRRLESKEGNGRLEEWREEGATRGEGGPVFTRKRGRHDADSPMVAFKFWSVRMMEGWRYGSPYMSPVPAYVAWSGNQRGLVCLVSAEAVRALPYWTHMEVVRQVVTKRDATDRDVHNLAGELYTSWRMDPARTTEEIEALYTPPYITMASGLEIPKAWAARHRTFVAVARAHLTRNRPSSVTALICEPRFDRDAVLSMNCESVHDVFDWWRNRLSAEGLAGAVSAVDEVARAYDERRRKDVAGEVARLRELVGLS